MARNRLEAEYMAQQQHSKENTYSTYYRELDDEAKVRYREKLAILGHVDDPYIIARQSAVSDWQQWPEVEYPDIFNYLVTTPSLYTQDQLKAYKSLDAYNFSVNGWVSNVSVVSLVSRPGTFLALAHVKHSQRISAAPLKPWIAVEKVGTVLCAHCTCMAGLGEACSHIAALLFTLEANTQMKKRLSCTSLPCSWLPPSFRSVPYAPISEIDFSTPRQKRTKTCETFALIVLPYYLLNMMLFVEYYIVC